MIEQLTIERLTHYGVSPEQIERLMNWEGHTFTLMNDEIKLFASNSEHKIYTGKDAMRKYYFRGGLIAFPAGAPDLIPEYFEQKMECHLKDRQTVLGKELFNKQDEIELFKKNEIRLTENSILTDMQLARKSQVFADAAKVEMAYIKYVDRWNADDSIDPLSFIDPDLLPFFYEAEIKAKGGVNGKFSKIRCAAFCELLYSKGYFIKQEKIDLIKKFARHRYGYDLEVSMKGAEKRKERNNHKNFTVGELPPLKNCF